MTGLSADFRRHMATAPDWAADDPMVRAEPCSACRAVRWCMPVLCLVPAGQGGRRVPAQLRPMCRPCSRPATTS